eukprot:CAMPEP_0172559086 /NCGR_PEP_ID=MMETSP1067-20121228/82440_1 /TAXON_ID=265564 ORGANISM="Thalassiosira punctigera, Strain Tpunct2005C2" /NCGR_SAMPLE_ID=MMETSP1067 /ASSEMBLY_ACC=CAM_ASM_000444 /LENGTH=71 /DNA_ID=CAMNT_0013348599 /DNA_START=85 /DNA_END=297 /DNA_ORIENTATION=+
MDHHQSYPSPVYRANMVPEDVFERQAGHHCGGTATKDASSSTRSPTTVFAINELHNVFRMADDAIDRVDRR